jgi:acetyl esterase
MRWSVAEPGSVLDPDLQALRAAGVATGQASMVTLPLAEVRARVRAGDRLSSGGPEDLTVEDRLANHAGHEVPVRIYSTGDSDVTLVYAHGGGWVTGDLAYADEMCRFLAARAGCAVVSPDYRLSPEHPYPSAVDDVEAVARWVAEQPWVRGIAIGGDSAGGNLAAACSLRLRDTGGPRPLFQLLVYPVLDHDLTRPSYVEQAKGFPIGRADMAWFFDHYVPVDQRDDPCVSPLRASTLAGLPSTLLVIAAHDPLRDEAVAFADALSAASVKVDRTLLPTMCHGFLRLTGVSAGARAARDDIVAAVAQLVAQSGPVSARSDESATNPAYDPPAGRIASVTK